MNPSPDREKTLLFSEPYYNAKFVVLVKKAGKYGNAKSLKDLKGVVCTSQQSTAWYPLLSQIPGAKIQPALTDVPTMLVSLTSGKCDLLSCDEPTGMAAIKAYSTLKMISFSGNDGFKASADETHICAALAKKNTAMKEQIDKVLKEFSDADQVKLMAWAVKHQPSA